MVFFFNILVFLLKKRDNWYIDINTQFLLNVYPICQVLKGSTKISKLLKRPKAKINSCALWIPVNYGDWLGFLRNGDGVRVYAQENNESIFLIIQKKINILFFIFPSGKIIFLIENSAPFKMEGQILSYITLLQC